MTLKNPYKAGGMFEGASYLIFENAKQLRKNMTAAETALWMHLRKGVSGYKFRRQHPIGLYIADFYCHKVKLIVEIDGTIHNRKDIQEHDEKRQKDLTEMRYTVLRFTNQQVVTNVENVLLIIEDNISQLNNIQKQNTLP